MLRTYLLRHISRSSSKYYRTITTTIPSQSPTSSNPPPPSDFNRPSPPRLPKHLQEEFEKLQKQAESAPTGNVAEDGRELHPDMRRPIRAEFKGERNPNTGEIGGPKVEPTKHGDWSYGGRASDF
jgi:hypothetical protein